MKIRSYLFCHHLSHSRFSPKTSKLFYAAALNASPRLITAQQILAFLFAKATVALLNPLRSRKLFTHFTLFGSCRLTDSFRLTPTLAPWMSIVRMYRSPLLLIPSSCCLPPVDLCFGTKPKYAANSLPFLNIEGSEAQAMSAVAARGPTPGIVERSCATGWLSWIFSTRSLYFSIFSER